MNIIGLFHIWKEEYGEESLWCRTEQKGNTIDLMYFVHAAPMGQEESLESELGKKIKHFFDVGKKRKTNIAGKMALSYALSLSTGKKGGLGKFCLNKGNGSKEKAADVMAAELDECGHHGYSLQYAVHLNKFMVDWDIKEFFT